MSQEVLTLVLKVACGFHYRQLWVLSWITHEMFLANEHFISENLIWQEIHMDFADLAEVSSVLG